MVSASWVLLECWWEVPADGPALAEFDWGAFDALCERLDDLLRQLLAQSQQWMRLKGREEVPPLRHGPASGRVSVEELKRSGTVWLFGPPLDSLSELVATLPHHATHPLKNLATPELPIASSMRDVIQRLLVQEAVQPAVTVTAEGQVVCIVGSASLVAELCVRAGSPPRAPT